MGREIGAALYFLFAVSGCSTATQEKASDASLDFITGQDVSADLPPDGAALQDSTSDTTPNDLSDAITDIADDSVVDTGGDVITDITVDAVADVTWADWTDAALDVAPDSTPDPGCFPSEDLPSTDMDVVELPAPEPEVAHEYFQIQVLDKDTGMGIPGVTLTTTNSTTYKTDINGNIAYYEPGLMETAVFFTPAREGYSYPPGWLNFIGKAVTPVEGESAVFEMTKEEDIPSTATYPVLDSILLQQGVPLSTDYFKIKIVDAATGRGVPMVRVTAPDQVYHTDSNGLVAFFNPTVMDEEISLEIWSHGYNFEGSDGAGHLSLTPVSGGNVEVSINRVNVAERLYRISGQGIYKDTVLLKEAAPIAHPLINANTMGMDSTLSTRYDGKIMWIYGDSGKPSHPLGNFYVTAGQSLLPRDGGLAADVGVNMDFFQSDTGSVAMMAAQDGIAGTGAIWFSSLFTVPVADGVENLYAVYSRMDGWDMVETGISLFDPETESFHKVMAFEGGLEHTIRTESLPIVQDGVPYLYFSRHGSPVRVRQRPEDVVNPETYEVYTCLTASTPASWDTDESGTPVYSWKAMGSPVSVELVEDGTFPGAASILNHMRDTDSATPVSVHNGTIRWNPHRGRYVRIFSEAWGLSSFLGEVWYAEGDTPMGPWVYATKIVTHEGYTFYNPFHHSFLDEDSGRFLYFDGTLSGFLSVPGAVVPRYNYNGMMYRLDLDTPALNLPVAVYDVNASSQWGIYRTKSQLSPDAVTPDLSFFALERPSEGAFAVVEGDGGVMSLSSAESDEAALFYAYPVDSETAPASTVALQRYEHIPTGTLVYRTLMEITPPEYAPVGDPVARVWPNPMTINFPVGNYHPSQVHHDLCTELSCDEDGLCHNAAVPGCCTVDSQCDDADPCTTDSCPAPGSTCSFLPK